MKGELPIVFDGKTLNDYCTPLFDTDVLLLPETEDTYLMNKFSERRFGKRVIRIPCVLKFSNEQKRQELSAILSVKEPKQLIMGRSADRYYMAIPDGNISVGFGKYQNTFDLQFVCKDPRAYALATKTFPAILNSDGILEATIVNDGTADVPISYEITHNADNGYIGIVSAEGAMEYGQRDEIDKENQPKAEKVISFEYDVQPPEIVLGEGISAYPNYLSDPAKPNVVAGSFKFGKNKYGTTIAEPVWDNTKVQYWGGPRFRADIPTDSHGSNTGNFIFRNRFDFTTSYDKAGRTEFVLESNGEVAFSIVIRDSNYRGDEMCWELFAKHTMIKSGTLDRKRFINGVYFVSLNRTGSRIDFRLARTSGTITGMDDVPSSIEVIDNVTLDYMADVPITGLTIQTLAFRKVAPTNQGITNTAFYWTDVENIVDLPNSYTAGDVFYIDGDIKKPYLNGVSALKDEIIGTQYFKAPPGTSKVQFYFSDFDGPLPTVTSIIREAWL